MLRYEEFAESVGTPSPAGIVIERDHDRPGSRELRDPARDRSVGKGGAEYCGGVKTNGGDGERVRQSLAHDERLAAGACAGGVDERDARVGCEGVDGIVV